jgi:PPOX class probable F420-dependent enzyme
MTTLNPAARELIESGRLAHWVTVNPDGSPQVSCVWVGLDGDEIVMAHLGTGQKLKNLRRDPRVVLSIEAEGLNATRLQEYLVVYGTARITEGGGPELLQRLARVYIAPDAKFPDWDDPPAGHVVHVTVDRAAGSGPWVTGEAV